MLLPIIGGTYNNLVVPGYHDGGDDREIGRLARGPGFSHTTTGNEFQFETVDVAMKALEGLAAVPTDQIPEEFHAKLQCRNLLDPRRVYRDLDSGYALDSGQREAALNILRPLFEAAVGRKTVLSNSDFDLKNCIARPDGKVD